jgi:small subunit ribosomal protein S21
LSSTVIFSDSDRQHPNVAGKLAGSRYSAIDLIQACRSNSFPEPIKGGSVVKLNVRDRESIQEAVRRFRKLVERSGIKKEMRRREYYEKPSETRRRARLRAERRARRARQFGI